MSHSPTVAYIQRWWRTRRWRLAGEMRIPETCTGSENWAASKETVAGAGWVMGGTGCAPRARRRRSASSKQTEICWRGRPLPLPQRDNTDIWIHTNRVALFQLKQTHISHFRHTERFLLQVTTYNPKGKGFFFFFLLSCFWCFSLNSLGEIQTETNDTYSVSCW